MTLTIDLRQSGYRALAAALCLGGGALSGSAQTLETNSAADVNARWSDAQTVETLPDRLAELLGTGSRIPGSAENLALTERVAARFAQSGFEHGEMRFPAPAFEPGRTRLVVGEHTFPLLTMHPTLLRPGNFHEDAFSTELVYGGYGNENDFQALDGVELDGRLVFMEFNSGRNWKRFLRFGVKGFIFASAPEYAPRESYDKVFTSEAALPRFYAEAETSVQLRERLSETRRVGVRVEAEPSRWENRELRNLWVLIPGADPRLSDETVVITAPLDANSVVPELATGAQSGANLNLLLELLDDFGNNPPARSVLLSAVNARTHNYLGDRVLAWYLLSPGAHLEAIRDALANDFRFQELIDHYYSRLQFTDDSFDADEQLLIQLRTLSDGSIGRQVTIKEPVVALSKRDVNEVKAQQLILIREESDLRIRKERLQAQRVEHGGETGAELRSEIEHHQAQLADNLSRREALTRALDEYVNVLMLFNRVGVRTRLSDLNERENAILRGYVEDVLDRSRRSATLNRADLDRSLANASIRETLGGRRVLFALSLELVWSRDLIGFSSGAPLAGRTWASRWGRTTVRVAEQLAASANPRPNLLGDTMTSFGGLAERHYIPHTSGAVFPYQLASRTPAFNLNNLYSGWGMAFTPADRQERLDAARVAETTAFTRALLRAILADIETATTIDRPSVQGRASRLWSCLLKAYKFDEFAAGVVPEIPVPNSSLVLSEPVGLSPALRMAKTEPFGFSGGDVMEHYLALTDERATTIFYGLMHARLSSSVFRFDDHFRHVDHVVDAGETHRKASSDITMADVRVLSVIPAAAELVVYDRLDTPMVGTEEVYARTFYPLSAARNSEPRKYGMSGAASGLSGKAYSEYLWGPVSFYAEPGDRLQVLTEFKRTALNVTDTDPNGIGFAHQSELGPDFFRQTLRDMRRLNRHRYREFRGITDELVEAFLERSAASEDTLDEAAAANRHLDYLQAHHEALGAQAKAYEQITSITNDMLKAVIFFMALLLPFCFFVQKLLFKTTRIERQMGLFAILFVACYLVFRFIHPAFAIAQAPEAMFIAFVMGGLGLFVVAILHGRFEGEMQFLFSTITGGEQSEAAYSMVSQQAMMIGVNNMKRRRIRTLLTTATIVLVTFTMLAFTSVSRRMSPTMIPRSSVAPYSGVMFHWAAGQTMDEGSHRVFGELLSGDQKRVSRYWLMPPARLDQTAPFQVENARNGQTALIGGALGLAPDEDGFLTSMPLIEGRFFSDSGAMEVLVTANLAGFLGLSAEDVEQTHLRFGDRQFLLTGILDDERLRSIEDINGLSILPIEQLLTGMGEDAGSDDGLDEGGVFYVSTSQLLVFPSGTARRMGAEPYSISVQFADDTPIWPIIERILTATTARFFAASRAPFAVGELQAEGRSQQPGIYFIGSGYRTSIGGLAMLIIPLLIASTIILNTMLGSVFERKNEIAVFNAVGLNPTHIGLFFLAESFVYAIIGSVGGYLIGQVLSIVLNAMGWVEDINLNFSSLSVAYVIVFTVSVVLLSTLYPAVVATKAAVPSGKRKWSMPAHDGDQMEVVFPFIYQPEVVIGVMAYLTAYLEQFNEASVGDLLVQRSGLKCARDAQDRITYHLGYHIALAPFDLGVTQKVDFDAAFDDHVGAYRVIMTNRRLTGQDSNWVTTNKPFLERLRKYLLQWRNLKLAEHALFVKRGTALFAEER